jgi:hypothetical protein
MRGLTNPFEKNPVFARAIVIFGSDRVESEEVQVLSARITHCFIPTICSPLGLCVKIFTSVVEAVIIARVR